MSAFKLDTLHITNIMNYWYDDVFKGLGCLGDEYHIEVL